MSYISQKQGANPAGLAAAVLINGAVVAAAFMTSMVVLPKIAEPGVTTFNVPIDQPPPVPPQKTEQEVPLKKPDPVYLDKPIVSIPAKPMDQISTTDVMTNIPLVTDPDGTKIALNTGVKDVIERILPPSVFRSAARDPKFARHFQPAYPVGLLQREIEGKATIKVLIGTDGRVRQANVVSATHADFGKAAQKQALNEWRFTPATRDGKPVEDWQTLTVRFDINE
jgi:periplasmic protein TonB